MPFSKIVKREIEVAFSKRVQPLWVRVLKYIVLGGLVYFFRREKLFWIVFAIVVVLALLLHFWVRYKTKRWTRSYGWWRYDGK